MANTQNPDTPLQIITELLQSFAKLQQGFSDDTDVLKKEEINWRRCPSGSRPYDPTARNLASSGKLVQTIPDGRICLTAKQLARVSSQSTGHVNNIIAACAQLAELATPIYQNTIACDKFNTLPEGNVRNDICNNTIDLKGRSRCTMDNTECKVRQTTAQLNKLDTSFEGLIDDAENNEENDEEDDEEDDD